VRAFIKVRKVRYNFKKVREKCAHFCVKTKNKKILMYFYVTCFIAAFVNPVQQNAEHAKNSSENTTKSNSVINTG
jgi:hypothetical protein